ncbi:hypothetical protein RhiirA4_489997 [Rhizophagus irregularis]|uniref:Uncharacterized protein n=1 Tax=Rhizophagus irregularis TaxID=588596 RepID=A0A2I1HVA6_9GLOM|nr:hypothetical protein RhiirA4_489997 [Rhizophagus irregularis]
MVLNNKVYPSSGFNLISIIPLFIVNEQAAIIYYSPIINKHIFSKYVYGLVGGLEEEFVDFNAHTDHILTNLSIPNKYNNNAYIKTSIKGHFLPRFYQASVDSLVFCQESLYFYLEQLRYFCKHIGRTKNVTLRECVQNIENMLKEYYLNTDFLNLLVEDNNKVNDKTDNKV